MWVRERDAVDYALVGAVTLLLYLRLPFRPAIRDRLRWIVDSVATWIEESPEAVVATFVVVVALVGAAFVLGVVRHAST
ncbi:hypothetical protein [Halorarum salinum]|uniref:Uncharacterized protein n=1 Tax=Halorarum salinum TaxID=2743089 RepID=A0A7D5QJQ2_9EURY|nr:hypothetical protein [Halobaculum salinum]QLG61565.1 hypothetical protein HUG12_07430 [Halobaculum salinum]